MLVGNDHRPLFFVSTTEPKASGNNLCDLRGKKKKSTKIILKHKWQLDVVKHKPIQSAVPETTLGPIQIVAGLRCIKVQSCSSSNLLTHWFLLNITPFSQSFHAELKCCLSSMRGGMGKSRWFFVDSKSFEFERVRGFTDLWRSRGVLCSVFLGKVSLMVVGHYGGCVSSRGVEGVCEVFQGWK